MNTMCIERLNISSEFVFRCETFREALLPFDEIRSLLPSGVCMVALMATATRTLQRKVAQILDMHTPKVIAVSSCKDNIMYAVATLL